jgi:hypothetical protein
MIDGGFCKAKYPMRPQTDEIILRHTDGWQHYHNPHRKILQIDRLDQILPTFMHELETLVEANGWHAAGFLSYESAPAFDPALSVRPDPSGFPAACGLVSIRRPNPSN